MTRWLVAVLLCGIAVLAGEEAVLVVHKEGDSVGLYRTRDGTKLAEIAVGRKPHEVVVSRDQQTAYVTNYGVGSYTQMDPGGNTVSIVDLKARQKIADIDTGDFRRPHGIEIGTSGRLYVTTDFPAAVLVIDPAARKLIRAYKLEDTLPHMLAVSKDESKAYVACAGSGSVAVLSLADGTSKSIEIGGVPMGIIFSPDERRVFATNRNGEAVAVIDTASDTQKTKLPLVGQPARLRISPDGKWMVVTTIGSGEAYVVEMLTLKPRYKVPVGRAAEGVVFDAKGRFVYMTAQGEDKVVKMSTEAWRSVLEIRTGAKPDTPVVLDLK